MPLVEFARFLSAKTEASIVVDAKLDQRPVTLEVTEQSLPAVLGVVARRLGVELDSKGSLYYLGSLRPQDRGVLVRRVRRLSPTELRAAVETLVTHETGALAAFDDGLLVVGDRVEVLERLDSLLDRVESSDSPAWVVQLYLVSIGDQEAADLGVDAVPAADIALAFAAASQGGSFASATLTGGLDAVLRASRETSGISVVANPTFYMADGGTVNYSRGNRVPIPRRSVSDQGTVQTVGFDLIDVGLSVQCQLRELSIDRASLSVDLEMSEIASIGELGAPSTTRESYTVAGPVTSGGVYLLGSVERSEVSKSAAAWLRNGFTHRHDNRLLQVWARAMLVSGASLTLPDVGEGEGGE